MLYVDKTKEIHNLVTGSNYCFLSRPRRFGKSLTLATIEAIFSGRRELFKGLWIENNWDWSQVHPVVHIPMNRIGYATAGLEQALQNVVFEYAEKFNITLQKKTYDQQFRELILQLAAQSAPVVLLIDEYDKPLIDYLEKDRLPLAQKNRETLKTFYSGLKDKDSQDALRFFMITGVSKFSQVSIFSDLNYLDDITLNRKFGKLVGYTQAELESHFGEWMTDVLPEFPEHSHESLLVQIKQWYNGYTWNGRDYVYNPFSILQFFSNGVFRDFWFKTGTPTFLIQSLQERNLFNLNDLSVSGSLLESYDLENLDVRAMLFQTGYLTIKKIDNQVGQYLLDYPNREVEQAMHNHLIAALLHRSGSESLSPVVQLRDAFLNNDLEKVMLIINSLLKDLPSHLLDGKDEHFYHSLVHLHFRYLGLFIQSEPHTSDGRMDAVVQTPTHTYILEFKLDESAEAALAQIERKDYAAPYRLDGKTIIGIGVNFVSGKKALGGWLQKNL
jgi:hypothetical protein